MKNRYEIIVIGAGHAGIEASLAAARMGHHTLMLTSNVDNIGQMSCNPAIGGLGKGQLVKEIDALGGEMGRAIDQTGIQFRTLNTTKGPAVWSSRAQADRAGYRAIMKWVLEHQENLDIKQAMAESLIVEETNGKKRVRGIRTAIGEEFIADAIILTTGTFLKGMVSVGDESYPAGRMGDAPAIGLSDSLMSLGFSLNRFSTSTTPRLDGRTIDWKRTTMQPVQIPIRPFSFRSDPIHRKQLPCYITYTNAKTHEVIRNAANKAGKIDELKTRKGPRYCPNIEEKVLFFPEKERHQIFLEPEGFFTTEVYPNGVFTTLSLPVQNDIIRSIEGLEDAEIVRPGYAIAYDMVIPTQLFATLETKTVENLFLAGQINGTSGYEEAAAQGIIAGINAALKLEKRPPLVLKRSEAYIGVLIDDLVTKGADEPYRMFTSRAEYRLHLREGNSIMRLTPYGREVGLIDDDAWKIFTDKKREMERGISILEQKITPTPEINESLSFINVEPIKNSMMLKDLLKRPGVEIERLRELAPELTGVHPEILTELAVDVKYEGYLKRQEEEINRFAKMERVRIPDDFAYRALSGLSLEAMEKLEKARPRSVGQASRISGITPAAVSILLVHLKRIGAV